MHRHEEPHMAESSGVHWLRDHGPRARVLLHGDRDRRRHGEARWVRPLGRLAHDGQRRPDGRHRGSGSVRFPGADEPSRAHAPRLGPLSTLRSGAGVRYERTSGAQSATPTTLSKVATPPDTTENPGDTTSATTPDST